MLTGFVLLAFSPITRTQEAAEADLEAVREQISALEARIFQDAERRDDGARELERIERQVAEMDGQVRQLTAGLEEQEQRERALVAEAAETARRVRAEQTQLADQVRLSFRTGRQEGLKLLLSQENPADFGRMLTYYDYLNRARSGRIDAANAELSVLAQIRLEARAAREEIAELRDAQSAELDRLAGARQERAGLLDRLDRQIADSGRAVEELRAEEARLTELVAELALMLEGFPVGSEAPFADWQGRLSWPIEGEIEADFGQLREGGPLRWNGVMLSAPAGTPVQAVYHGRVAFADWLPGLGQLLIIDHGEQFMSLYGHNERLLPEPGDWVSPGEVIAEVGESGGRRQPALYFEIRRGSEPQDPHQWIP